jgi:hypothetical protein
MDLPLFTGDEDPVAPYVAGSGVPWPGSVALYAATQDAGYGLNRFLTSALVIGQTQTVLQKACSWLLDRSPVLRVKMIRGNVKSLSVDQLLSEANLAVIGDGSAQNWEVFQFAQAEIVNENTFDLCVRFRGQAGSNAVEPDQWPEGSIFVLLDGRPQQIELASSARDVTQHYRYGPGTRPLSDPSYQYRTDAFSGIGLRPYSVCHLQATPSGAGLDVSWIRRARIGGDAWGEQDVPLSKSFERYVVRVFKAGVQTRQTTVSKPNWTYTSQMNLAYGAGKTRIDVAQTSDTYGEGPVVTLTLAA